MKKIIYLIDGTWNYAEQDKGGNGSLTNVKLLHDIFSQDQSISPRPEYDDGVGSHGGKIRRFFDGYTGTGTTERIIKAYRHIRKNYAPGDQIFLFGFSRGAFAVRSLAGFIRKCGLVREDAFVRQAYDFYRDRKSHPDDEVAKLFRGNNCNPGLQDVPIHCIGVFDTVGALGNPLAPRWLLVNKASQFHDTTLSSTVNFAFHAMACNERRWLFRQTEWKVSRDKNTGLPKNSDQVLEQCWFIGAHSDVGGGYTQAGLSRIALLWMIEKIRQAGIDLEAAGIRIPQSGTPQLICHDETRSLPYRLMPKVDRDIEDSDDCCSEVHETVVRFMQLGSPERRVLWPDGGYVSRKLIDYLKKHGKHS